MSPKAGLLAAAARAVGIPARLGFADVRNHLATERLRRAMGTDVFYYHACVEPIATSSASGLCGRDGRLVIRITQPSTASDVRA